MILTDHAACLAFPKTTDVTDRNVRWLTFLSGFDYTIQHLEGKKNNLADTLSRYFKNPTRLPPIIRKPDQNKEQQQLQATTTSKQPTTTSLLRGYCHDFGYVWLGNVEFGSVALGNVELFGSVVCGMSVIELL